MSQFYQGVVQGDLPPTVPTTFQTQNGNATPQANTLIINGSNSTENNTNGIITKGGVAGTGTINEVDIVLTNRIQASVTTTDATPTSLFSFPMGSTPATYNFDMNFAAYDRTNNKGAVYKILYGVRTDGIGGTAISFTTPLNGEDTEFSPSSLSISQSGNNFTGTVTGIAATTINWQAAGTYVKAF